MDAFVLWADRYAIELYRITGNPLLNYFIGTFLLAVISVLVGEATLLLLRGVNRVHMERLDRELSEKHALSMESKHSGDEDAYRDLNRQANDAFGKVFFNMFTFSAASLWPVFIALSWMQTRFMKIAFPLPVHVPLIGRSTSYVFTFLLLYILVRIFVRHLKRSITPAQKTN